MRGHSLLRSVVLLCVTLLVAAQVLGLHYHRHVDLGAAAPAHGGDHAPHASFRDAGASTSHEHDHGQEGAGHEAHDGVDVEIEGVAGGAAEAAKAPLLFAVLLMLLPVLARRRAARVPRRRAAEPVAQAPPRYRLPPSQAPPAAIASC